MPSKKVVNTSGKRKTAVARATVLKGKGLIRINNTPLELYQPDIARWKIMEPLTIAGDTANTVNITVNVKGGGFMSQANAIRTAIARGLIEFTNDADLKLSYLEYDRSLLVNDPRRKESKKPLGRGARKKRQKSYRWSRLIIPVRCFTCGNVISQAYEEYKKRFLAYKNAVNAGEIPKETPKQILDDLGIERYCCRRMIISHVDLLEEASPYE
jgi:small subunit ribosomal protein S9